jgi:uncharacterized circularly permuted ATP-grasp superfamily protein/uncharacterized alpha-E superfamily protein
MANLPAAHDEMVDGRGRIRPQWRGLLSTFGAMSRDVEGGETPGRHGLAERVRRLDRAFEEEGVTTLLPGAAPKAWRCDPVPLPLSAAEFAGLEAGLAQRARLLNLVLADVYGPQALLSSGALPPALVFANPAFLRACRCTAPGAPARTGDMLDFYVADLIRGPDGEWRVLADRTASPSGVGYASENRRLLARVVPEAFRGAHIRQLHPFFDGWRDALQRLAPAAAAQRASGPAIALLTEGIASRQWFEQMFLSRALSCALVEGGDLTVRGGGVFLKTLRGLQPVDVLLRRVDGRLIDSLELEARGALGVPGLLDAARSGAVRITNEAGSGAAEAPALAAYLPALAMRLLGEPLALPSVPTMWLGEARARSLVEADPERWLIRSAVDGRQTGSVLSASPPHLRRAILAEIAACPWAFAATAALPPSMAPCAGAAGLEPRPVVLRLFLMFDGRRWRAMEGGLARVVEQPGDLAGALPMQGLSKDVWVMSEDEEFVAGPRAVAVPPLPVRRTAGDLPSRVADNFFWLGRYVERLEGCARLIRAAIHRLDRGDLLPHELTELQVLAGCLAEAGLIPEEASRASTSLAPLVEALHATLRENGSIVRQLARVGRLSEGVRDRLTGEMYAAFTHALREVGAEAPRGGRSLEQLAAAMTAIVRFAAEVAGVAAENMVRGGGWLFLDLGRRVERARMIAAEIAQATDLPPTRIESGLLLCLDLRDSAITYRTRYLTVLQPAPVLDLVLADPGNPRGLAFQLAAIRSLLDQVAGRTDGSLAAAAFLLLAETEALVERVAKAPDQAAEAALLPTSLRSIEAGVAALSDRITRRYFALLPAVRTVGPVAPASDELRGAA